MVIEVNMISRTELFTPPPHGHLGVYGSYEQPDCKPGEKISFIMQGAVIASGVIIALEPPGSNARPDYQNEKILKKWKIHWFPYTLGEQTDLNPCLCPQCGKRAITYNTIQRKDRIIRYRRCPKGCKRWLTEERFANILTTKERRK